MRRFRSAGSSSVASLPTSFCRAGATHVAGPLDRYKFVTAEKVGKGPAIGHSPRRATYAYFRGRRGCQSWWGIVGLYDGADPVSASKPPTQLMVSACDQHHEHLSTGCFSSRGKCDVIKTEVSIPIYA